MRYRVLMTDDARSDLESIYDYIAESDSQMKAEHVLDRVLDVVNSLESHPERGRVPAELQELGIREYRQVHFKPYRVIYEVTEKQVIIYLIADGRRDMQSLLARRLLGS